MNNQLKSTFVLGIVLATATVVHAATITWSGASGTDTNWSNAGNWAGGVPTGGDDVKFFDAGTNGTTGLANNFADGAFAGFIGSLQFGNTNGVHTTVIAPGTSLNITNGNLVVGTPADISVARNLTNSISGLAATLNLSNTTAQLAINQGSAASITLTRATLDLSGLGTFNANLRRIGLGSTVFQNPGNALQREAGSLFLARTNLIVLSLTDTLANYQTAGRTNALEMVRNPGNPAGIMSFLYLGQTNAIYVDSMGFGRDKASATSAAWMGFNPAFSNPVAYIRGASGDGSRVTWWAIGDMNANASSAQVSVGTNDFTGGTVDAMVDVLSLGRDCSPSHTATANNVGTLTFSAGTIDANTMYVGNQSLGPNTSTAPNLGFINVNGSAILRVNSVLVLGRTTQTSGAAALATRGVLNIRNGTVLANSISAGSASANNNITLTNGTLCITNTAGTATKGISAISATNSTFQFILDGAGAPKIVVTNLVTGGTGNTISFPAIAVFASYPTQFTLVKYTGTIGGAGYNFVAGAIPGSAPGAFLSNNTLSASIDLVLPIDPKPVITSLPNSYGGSPGDNVSFTVGYSGSTPFTFQWLKDGTNLVDGLTGSGSTLSGSATNTLAITNAQDTDSGSYALIVSNPYGSVTSSPPASLLISTNDIAPIINGPTGLTVVQGNNATLTTTVSGKPVPAIQWYKNGVELSGETSANLTVLNAQYPADQATYSIVASNAAGLVTNSAFLTVIVAPVIAVPPASLVVTNTQAASFTVVSTNGVPAVNYQWRKNGGSIANATNATYNIASASPADIGNYSVIIANAAGTVISSDASLIVNSTMTTSSLTPANSAANICYDTPLYITFSVPPLMRNAGTIKIFNATNTVTPVDTLDLSLNVTLTQIGTGIPSYPINVQPRLIAGAAYTNFPVIISGNTAALYPHSGVMTSNQTYYVTVDNGVFTDTAGAYFAGITDTNAWRFATKPAGPPVGTNYVVVAADGSADFATLQGAVDFLPNASTNRLIFVRNGVYQEIVNIPVGKNNITVRGENRKLTRLQYHNSNIMNPNSHQVMVLHVRANDIAIENLTLTNSVPQGGSQSFALMVESGAKHFICNYADVDSYQDTILVNTSETTAYFYKTLIQGDVDFIWGGGNCFFTNCELRELRTGGIYLQPRTDPNSNGMSFVRCNLTRFNGTNASGSNFTNCLFARALNNTNSNAALILCNIDTNVVQTGWTPADISSIPLRWWEFGNSNLDGTLPVAYNGIQLTNNDPRLLAARDSTTWLYGWVPQLAPNILTNPANQNINGGQTATFAVFATGISDPAYYWLKDGTNLIGQTSATLTINNATVNDAGTYSVIVSNAAGIVTSTSATLTVGNTAPLLAAVSDQTVNVGVTVNVSNVATDPDVPSQALSFALLSGPGSVDSGSGLFTWRPQVTDSDSTNIIKITVTDNGAPNLSATNTFNVIVNPLNPSSVISSVIVGGQFALTAIGDLGPDYALQGSTNLVNWDTLFITNSPPPPFTLVDTNTADHPLRFYRIKAGPPLP